MPLDNISQLLHQLEQQPTWKKHQQFRQVLKGWVQAVGPVVACQTQPVRLEKGMLYVTAANPVWAQTLMFERLRILAKLNATVNPPLTDIRFSSGDWFGRSSPLSQGMFGAGVRLENHPSFTTRTEAVPTSRPKTALEAFQQWAKRHQAEAQRQPRCPRCTCPCPPGELQRWTVCCFCATKSWQVIS